MNTRGAEPSEPAKKIQDSALKGSSFVKATVKGRAMRAVIEPVSFVQQEHQYVDGIMKRTDDAPPNQSLNSILLNHARGTGP